MNGLAVDPLTPRPASIARVVRETRDTFTLALDVSGWPGGLRFAPGQFNMLYRFGAGEVPISISGRAERRAIADPRFRDELGAHARAVRWL